MAATASAPTSVHARSSTPDWPAAIADLFARYGDDVDSAAWTQLRTLFQLDPELTYLNTAGLGPSPDIVINTVVNEMFVLERISESGHARVAEAREKASAFLACDVAELAFTRSTTEGMNAIARGLPLAPGDEILLTTHEHPGGSMPWVALARDRGLPVRTVEPGGGPDETLELLECNITARTRVVSVSHVTCTTGYVLPIRRIAQLCRDRDVLLVVDGAQAVGMIPVDLHALGCHFYATSGHKWLLGPKGTGILYINADMLNVWRPTWVGAYSDRVFDLAEARLETMPEARASEYGTRNTANLLGLAAALDYHCAIGPERVVSHGRSLSQRLADAFADDPRVELLTPLHDGCAASSIVTLRFPRSARTPWDWCNHLKREHRLRARPVGEAGLNAVRISSHLFNTADDLNRAISAITAMLDAE